MTKARCVLPACACNAERSASRNFPCGVQCRVGAVDCRYWRSLLASCLTPLPSSSSRKTSAVPEMFFGDLFQVFYFCWLQRDWRGVQSWWLAVRRCSFLIATFCHGWEGSWLVLIHMWSGWYVNTDCPVLGSSSDPQPTLNLLGSYSVSVSICLLEAILVVKVHLPTL